MKPLSLRQAVAGIAIVAVISAIAVGLLLLGSPAEQRMFRMDERRVDDLAAIARATDLFWTRLGRLPESFEELRSEPGSSISTGDPATGTPYEYARIDDTTYEVCATFQTAATQREPRTVTDFWTHGEGRQCFRREAQRVR